ncbi:MAG: S8 family serine peptidase, partial [Gemmatimonadetes bacterium]|nr:S8 family serine peptidase [Gemmatimonadota bacterium]NIS29161.1 S8 family serine peptidase [Actinomycetota bacterium]NIU68454.1 S8 family serine peptidase [Actinomycetota bacterium]NIW30281.1 S8 family serine peptidase [Actinomycetota bacterium]NIX22699.1 S8 family serine peptidase [Actinomycetota bacterium]
LDDDGNGWADDYYGFDFKRMRAEVGAFGTGFQHGTTVAGIIAGDGTGGTVTGVAPRARIMSLLGLNTV